MNTTISPLISEFETKKQEENYTAWLRSKTIASLTETHKPIPHDEVMTEIDTLINQIEQKL
ncbi:MAG TPA: type II toxin-antitoxin system RelB family antitoxin [Xylella sp.]